MVVEEMKKKEIQEWNQFSKLEATGILNYFIIFYYISLLYLY